MNILGVLNEKFGGDHLEGLGSSTWYRCILPIQTLDKLDGVNAAFCDGFALLDAYHTGRLKEFLSPGWDALLMQRGVISNTPMGRLDWRHFVKAVHAAGSKIIMDYDDDYTGHERDIGSQLPDLSLFDVVTVSTGRLVDISREFGARKVRLIPNRVVPSMFQDLPRVIGIGKLVVGISGGSSHIGDYDAIVPALVEIAKRDDVLVGAFGYLPDVLRPIPGLLTMRDIIYALNGVDVEMQEFYLPFHQYGYIWAQVDIALCPVDPRDRYSWSRSPVKAYEAMASRRHLSDGRLGGCAVIGSYGSPVYENVLDGSNGLLVPHNADSYHAAITHLLDNDSVRQDMQVMGKLFVENHIVDMASALWLRDTYAGALFDRKTGRRRFANARPTF